MFRFRQLPGVGIVPLIITFYMISVQHLHILPLVRLKKSYRECRSNRVLFSSRPFSPCYDSLPPQGIANGPLPGACRKQPVAGETKIKVLVIWFYKMLWLVVLFAKLLRLLLLFFAALAFVCLVLWHNTNKIHILWERFVVWTVANIIIKMRNWLKVMNRNSYLWVGTSQCSKCKQW